MVFSLQHALEEVFKAPYPQDVLSYLFVEEVSAGKNSTAFQMAEGNFTSIFKVQDPRTAIERLDTIIISHLLPETHFIGSMIYSLNNLICAFHSEGELRKYFVKADSSMMGADENRMYGVRSQFEGRSRDQMLLDIYNALKVCKSVIDMTDAKPFESFMDYRYRFEKQFKPYFDAKKRYNSGEFASLYIGETALVPILFRLLKSIAVKALDKNRYDTSRGLELTQAYQNKYHPFGWFFKLPLFLFDMKDAPKPVLLSLAKAAGSSFWGEFKAQNKKTGFTIRDHARIQSSFAISGYNYPKLLGAAINEMQSRAQAEEPTRGLYDLLQLQQPFMFQQQKFNTTPEYSEIEKQNFEAILYDVFQGPKPIDIKPAVVRQAQASRDEKTAQQQQSESSGMATALILTVAVLALFLSR